MFECAGESAVPSDEVVTGRLQRACRGRAGGRSGATILLCEGAEDIDETQLSDAVGVVLLSCIDGEGRRRIERMARLFRLPALCISERDGAFLCCGREQVAILDSPQQRLFVDPDIETVSRYFSSRTAERRSRPELLLKGLRSSEVPCDGYVVGEELPPDMGEQEAYEYFCSIADSSTGMRLVASVSCSMDGERLKSRIRAVYRAGVWGRFSLLCTGICVPEETDRCLSFIHGAFCELDRERREFNGFMPKGMAVHTPIMLLSPPRHRFFDFFCLDHPSLLKGFTGRDTDSPSGVLTEYIKRFAEGAGNARIGISADGELPERIRELSCVSEIYLGKNTAGEL